MDIQIEDQQSALKLSREMIVAVVVEVIKGEEQRCDEVAIHFVDTATITALHTEYFGDSTPTDTISFPMDEVDRGGYRVLGEVFVCPETAIAYTQSKGGDSVKETVLYLIHGLLHLMGYDDNSSEDRARMRKAERFYLSRLEKLKLINSHHSGVFSLPGVCKGE